MAKLKLSDYLLIGEAAELLGVAQNTLRKWADDGKVKTKRHPLNGYRLFRRSDLEAVLKKVSESQIATTRERRPKKPR